MALIFEWINRMSGIVGLLSAGFGYQSHSAVLVLTGAVLMLLYLCKVFLPMQWRAWWFRRENDCIAECRDTNYVFYEEKSIGAYGACRTDARNKLLMPKPWRKGRMLRGGCYLLSGASSSGKGAFLRNHFCENGALPIIVPCKSWVELSAGVGTGIRDAFWKSVKQILLWGVLLQSFWGRRYLLILDFDDVFPDEAVYLKIAEDLTRRYGRLGRSARHTIAVVLKIGAYYPAFRSVQDGVRCENLEFNLLDGKQCMEFKDKYLQKEKLGAIDVAEKEESTLMRELWVKSLGRPKLLIDYLNIRKFTPQVWDAILYRWGEVYGGKMDERQYFIAFLFVLALFGRYKDSDEEKAEKMSNPVPGVSVDELDLDRLISLLKKFGCPLERDRVVAACQHIFKLDPADFPGILPRAFFGNKYERLSLIATYLLSCGMKGQPITVSFMPKLRLIVRWLYDLLGRHSKEIADQIIEAANSCLSGVDLLMAIECCEQRLSKDLQMSEVWNAVNVEFGKRVDAYLEEGVLRDGVVQAQETMKTALALWNKRNVDDNGCLDYVYRQMYFVRAAKTSWWCCGIDWNRMLRIVMGDRKNGGVRAQILALHICLDQARDMIFYVSESVARVELSKLSELQQVNYDAYKGFLRVLRAAATESELFKSLWIVCDRCLETQGDILESTDFVKEIAGLYQRAELDVDLRILFAHMLEMLFRVEFSDETCGYVYVQLKKHRLNSPFWVAACDMYGLRVALAEKENVRVGVEWYLRTVSHWAEKPYRVSSFGLLAKRIAKLGPEACESLIDRFMYYVKEWTSQLDIRTATSILLNCVEVFKGLPHDSKKFSSQIFIFGMCWRQVVQKLTSKNLFVDASLELLGSGKFALNCAIPPEEADDLILRVVNLAFAQAIGWSDSFINAACHHCCEIDRIQSDPFLAFVIVASLWSRSSFKCDFVRKSRYENLTDALSVMVAKTNEEDCAIDFSLLGECLDGVMGVLDKTEESDMLLSEVESKRAESATLRRQIEALRIRCDEKLQGDGK